MLTIVDCTLSYNSAYGSGGGLSGSGGTVTGTAFQGNSVYEDYGNGGGISAGGPFTVTNCTFVGNSAKGRCSKGGAIAGGSDALVVTNSTFSRNSASEGGGIYSRYSATVENSILWNNYGGQLESLDSITRSPTLLIADPKFVRAPSDGSDGWGDDPDTPNVDESANDDFGDLRLTAQSPAIGHGDNASAVDASGNPLETDMDGNARIYGGSVDCGAFEFQGEAAAGREAASLVVTTSEDAFDFYDGRTSLREAIYYAKSEPPGAVITFDEALDGATIALCGTELWIDRSLTVDASALGSLTLDAGGENRVFSIFAPTGSEVDLTHLTIANGRADNGGGIHVKEATVTVTNSKFFGNFACWGGGIFSDYESTLTVTNCALVGNSAYGGQGGAGGGIFSHSDNALTVTNCTLSGNASDSAGAVYYYRYYGPLILNNSILSRNIGGNLPYGHDAVINQCSLTESFARNPSDGGDGWGDDPSTPDINESANDDYGDLRLLPGSPAIDAGDNTLAVDADGHPLTVDVAGNLRIVGAAVDIGAYEAREFIPGDLNLDQAVDSADLDLIRGNWNRDVFPGSLIDGDPSGDGYVGSADLDIVRGNWGTILDAEAADKVFERTLFVDADAAAGGDGLGWGTAYDDLQSALESAAAFNSDGIAENDVEAIWIAEGVYKPTAELEPGDPRSASFSLADGVTLYGGFAGTETALTERDWIAHETILSGDLGVGGDATDNARTVVFCPRRVVAAVDGVTVTGGNADGIYEGQHRERHVGGGIFNSGTLTVSNSILLHNTADAGGAIFNGTVLEVVNSTFEGNAADRGGGVFNYMGTMHVANSTFSGNSARGEGGDNGKGGAVHNLSTATITNSTLAGNSATAGGGGIFSYGTLTLRNSILWCNGGGDLEDHKTLSVSQTLIGIDPQFVRDPSDGGDGWGDDPDTPGVDESANDDCGDLRLTSQSPAIDYGDGAAAVDAQGNPLATDFGGNPRNYGGSPVDAGAYEFQDAMAAGRETASLVVNTPEDAFDLYDGQVSLREAIYYAATDSPNTTITFDAALDGATITLDGAGLWIDKGLTIDAAALASLTIDADGRSRGVAVVAPADDEVELIGLTVTHASVKGHGGGIYNAGTLKVTACSLSDNAAEYAGGISNCGGTLTVLDSTFSGNTAVYSGGGIDNYGGTATVTNGTFRGNSATYGGGICNYQGTLAIANVALWDNSACQGGALCNSDATLSITSSTITGNAANDGGGIAAYDTYSNMTLHNTIVAQNAAGAGPDIYQDGGVLTGSYNLIGNGTTQMLVDGTDGNLVGTPGNPIDPLFVRNPSGGDPGDLHLQPGSPAVDAGNDALLPADLFDLDGDGNTAEPIPIDLAGGARVTDGNGDGVPTVDMGAYESAAVVTLEGDLNGDGLVGSLDLDIVRVNWNTNVPAGDLLQGDPSGDGFVGSADLDIVRGNWGNTVARPRLTWQ